MSVVSAENRVNAHTSPEKKPCLTQNFSRKVAEKGGAVLQIAAAHVRAALVPADVNVTVVPIAGLDGTCIRSRN